MTDTTDIAALRREALTLDRMFKAERFIGKILDQLEAERQRADAVCRDIRIQANDLKSAQTVNRALQAEIAALKGEQVPVAWRHDSDILCHKVVTMSEVVAKSWVDKGRSVTPLYDRPQKPVVLQNHEDCPSCDRHYVDGKGEWKYVGVTR